MGSRQSDKPLLEEPSPFRGRDVFPRLRGYRLNRSQRVFHSVIQFIDEQMRMLFGLVALRAIDQHINSSDKVAIGVMQGCRIGEEGNARAVRSLGDTFGAQYLPIFPQRYGHGALVMRHRRFVWPIELPG